MEEIIVLFIPILICGGVISAAIIGGYYGQMDIAKRWRPLAKDLALKVSPPAWFGRRIKMEGRYRKRWVQATTRTTGGKNPKTYTSIRAYTQGNTSPQTEAPAVDKLTYLNIVNILRGGNNRYLKGKFNFTGNGVIYEELGIIKMSYQLRQVIDACCDLLDQYPHVLALGSQAAPALKEIATARNEPYSKVAKSLLESIAKHSRQIYNRNKAHLFCANCLTEWSKHQASLGWFDSTEYYGCRTCGDSLRFIDSPLVAVLDSEMNEARLQRHGLTLVNWLQYREPFDFEAVGILQATDEEIERFVVKVGNDTDPERRQRYKSMRCVINPNCAISLNSERLLERTFGTVQRLDDIAALRSQLGLARGWRTDVDRLRRGQQHDYAESKAAKSSS